MVKRIFDTTTAAIILIAAVVLFVGIAIVLRLTQGQVFYRQVRIGQHHEPVTVTHFCTMYPGPETVDDTHRITPVGRVLRRSGLDTIPELWLVVRGRTSLVGPRLISQADDARWRHLPCWNERFSVKPGIVGPAQIEIHRNDWPAKLTHDLAYVRANTFWGDIKLLAKGVHYAVAGRCDGRPHGEHTHEGVAGRQ